MNVETYKNLIIGSGEGGKSLAWHLAAAGEQTVVVEHRWIGGSCPNVNCLPSKNEIWSAKVADLVHHARQYGIITGSASIDMSIVRERKRKMVEGLIAVHVARYKATGAELIMGEAKFVEPAIVEVKLNEGGVRTLKGERIFLNLGTHAAIPSTPGLAESHPLTHIEALELDRLPEHLVAIGGGYVGLEFAQAYRRFGSRVTIIQHGPQLLANQDPDVAAEILKILTAEGIEVIAPGDVARVQGKSGTGVTLAVQTPSGERTIQASDILVATGRIPNTAGIGLEVTGVELDPRGYIKTNDRLETTAPNIWAIGECAGSPQFTHVSYDDFRIIRDNLAGNKRSTRDRVIPSCLFIDPQVAQVGLTETEARARAIAFRIVKLPMAAVLRTRTLDETEGFMKALIGANDDKILGFTMVGPEAGEVMAVVQMAMQAGLPFTALRDAILTHPTMAEGLNVLFSGIKPLADALTVPDESHEWSVDAPSSGVTGSTARYTLVFVIVTAVLGLFGFAGGWLTPHALTPSRMVNTFEQVSGPHPGFRRNHAKGVCFTGYFDSNGQGAELSKASVFLASRVPVIGRFALAGGQPYQSDAPRTVRSMAILFKLRDGEQWRTGMNNTPVFAVNTPQAFYEQLLASVLDPVTGKPDPQKLTDFLTRNPASARSVQLIRSAPVSSGFDDSTFNSLDAFRFISADGKVTSVRWSMAPVKPFEPAGAAQPAHANPNYLFDALIESVHQGPLQWHLMITIGQPNDPTNDATLPWPPDRRQVNVGTLTIDHIDSEDTSLARDINFDPLVLPDGIAPSDDPLLSARSAAYAQSFTRREGEKKDPSPVSTDEVEK